MSWIDVAIASLVVISALRGWSQGLLRQLGALIGRVAGLVGGFYLAAYFSPRVTVVALRPLDVVVIVLACTVAGGLIMRYFGGVFSRRVSEGRLGIADSALGASIGAAGTLVICWLVAAVVALVPWGSVGQSVNQSLILRYMQHVMPKPPAVESRLQATLDEINVPGLFADVVGPTLPVISHGALGTTRHVTSPDGVVLIQALDGCHLYNSGTGFFVAPGEVVTVAHLLAGEKTILIEGRSARVISFDPQSDLAVVSVKGIAATPLALGTSSPRGAVENVVGYVSPGDRVSTGAISLGSVVAPGRDIYSGPIFTRTMDLVVASVDALEAGSPVLRHGVVVGVIAQRAAVDGSLAYVVPVAQLRTQLAHVSPAGVSTQHCVN
jgi:uncharacterized membrane protein required for colicin V production